MNKRGLTHHWPLLAVLLLSCTPLWGNDVQPRIDPEIEIDEAHSTFRVTGAPAKEAMVRNWRQPPLVLRGAEEGVYAVALSADGRLALSGGEDKTVRVWDTLDGKLLHDMKGHEGKVFGVALSADGRLALSGGGDGTVRVWNALDGKLLHTMKGHEGRVFAVVLSADGHLALSGGEDKTVRVWDARAGNLLHTMEGHEEWVSGVALSADGRLALSGDPSVCSRVGACVPGDPKYENSRSIRLWDTRDGKLLRTLGGRGRSAGPMALSADGRIAMSGSWNAYASLWDVATSEEMFSIGPDGDHAGSAVGGVSLSADGRLALSGRRDGTVILWDVANDKRLRDLEGHRYDATAMSLGADRRLAWTDMGDGDGEVVRLWDRETGKILYTMIDHDNDVHDVSLSADGRLALSGGGDGTVRLWRLPRFHPQSALHRASGRYAMQAVEARVGPAIPTPELPPIEERGRDDPSETMAAFEQHKARARTERKRQIGGIEARYRTAVERRNARVRAIDKNQGRGVQLTAYARAVVEVFGHPMLKEMQSYDAEATPPRMRIDLQFEHVEGSWDWVFEVPLDEPARGLHKALEAGEVSATTEYRLEDGVLSLVAVYAHHGDVQYQGVPGERYEHRVSHDRIPVLGLSTPGQGDQPPLLKPQIPNLKDVAFERYQTRHRPEFQDDLPGLYERAEAATPDPRKWLFAVGIEEYAQTDNIPHARRSAQWFVKAAVKALGVVDARQIVLRDSQATAAAITQRLREMLEKVWQGDHVYFYYVGHGIPAPTQGNAPHILPQDVVPDFVGEHEQYRMENIYRQLAESKAARVIAFMDTCFNGQTEHGSVFKGKGNARLNSKPFNPPKDGKLAILTACTKNQYPGPYPEKGHRLFSYFLIQELLRGEHASIGALAEQVSAHIAKTAKTLAHVNQQNPVLRGNPMLEP